MELQHGVSHFNYDIRDSGGLTATATITITYNRAPTIQPATASTGGQDTVQVPVLVTDLDGDNINISCPAPPDFVVVVLGPSGDPVQQRFDLIVNVPEGFNSNTNNTVVIRCTVSDGIAPPPFAFADMTITVV